MKEQTYYNPKFFDKVITDNKNGLISYFYKPKPDNLYWKLREQGNW